MKKFVLILRQNCPVFYLLKRNESAHFRSDHVCYVISDPIVNFILKDDKRCKVCYTFVDAIEYKLASRDHESNLNMFSD